MMMKFEIVYTYEAEADLLSIQKYISTSLKNPASAKKQIDKLITSIQNLDFMPLRYRLYPEEPWHSKGLRFFPVGNYLIFYVANEENNTIAIIRIMYNKRNIEKQLDRNPYT